MPRLLLAPAGHGKTERLIQRIRQLLTEEPFAPVIVLVPNAIQAANFRQRLGAGTSTGSVTTGGALGAEVHTFHTLYAELLTRAGQPLPLLPDPVRIRLLRAIVDDLCERGKSPLPLGEGQGEGRLPSPPGRGVGGEGGIRHYAALRAKPGFIALLRNTIEELKRARIFPDDFSASVKGLGARLEEIALVYAAYQDWLQKQNWADNEGRGWLAAIALESNPTLGADTRLLAVSGFDEFNPTQLAVLSILAARARETLITLTGDLQNPTRPAHHRFHRAQQAIISSLNLQPEAMDSSSMLSEGIANLEATLFDSVIASPEGAKQSPGNGGLLRRAGLDTADERFDKLSATRRLLDRRPPRNDVELVEAQTRALEARAALRWIKARVVRDGMKLSEVAILARDLESYRAFLAEVAEEFGIPLRIVGGQPLIENPAIAALLNLLSLPVDDWKRRPVLDSWRSPYFDWTALNESWNAPAGFEIQQERRIANPLRALGDGIDSASAATLNEISRAGRVAQGLSQWREAFEMWEKKKAMADEDGEAIRSVAYDEHVNEKFESFVELLTPPSRTDVKEHVAFVESLIGDDPALSPLPMGEGTGVRVVARARENESTREHDVAALRAFKDVLRGLVLAESVLQSDTLDYADFFHDLRGAVEAATYSVPAESGVMAASVLDARGLSFQAVALMGLSEGEFPKQEREDVLLRESDRAVLRQRGLPLETKLHGDEATFFYQAVTRARQRLLLTRPYLAEDGQAWEESPFWAEVTRLNGDPPPVRVRGEVGEVDSAEAASRVEWVESARAFDIHIQNGIEALRARMSPKAEGIYEGELFDLSERFGASHGWSASRLESYGTCPFEFFVAYGLELEPRPEAEEGFDVRALGSMLHKILEMVYSGVELKDAAGKVFASAPEEYGFRPTALWSQQQAELTRILEKTIAALNEASQEFTPRVMEARFGMGEPSLILKTSIGEIRLHGYIDRLDAAPDGTLRVIDYKSGSAAISAKDLKEGRRLQLPIYALAARDALGLGEVSSGFYWHIQKAEASSMKLEKFEGGANGAFEMAVAHVVKHVADIRAGHFEPKPPDEGCPSYCPATGFCWRHKRGF